MALHRATSEETNPAQAGLCGTSAVYIFVYVRDLAASRTFYENVLGLRVLEEDPGAVKYDAGGVILALNRATDFGVDIDSGRGSSLLVFHVDDVDRMRAALEANGAVFDETLRYEIGATAACYDPDGHCVTLYQPSPEAMGWPSGRKYQELVRPVRRESVTGLGDSPLVYVFLFVPDIEAAAGFYRDALRLPVLEVDEDEGVVKYDAGGLILATHPIEGVDETVVGAARRKSMSIVFHVDDAEAAYRRLRQVVAFANPPSSPAIGTVARFEDPSGHIFHLYQPSVAAMTWPSGAKLREIISAGTGLPG